ncbi:inositol monophosphatase [Pseudoclavibacter endophyticus]|nr:inositol monophosphatase [Pseudoclavibacter endophyticus]
MRARGLVRREQGRRGDIARHCYARRVTCPRETEPAADPASLPAVDLAELAATARTVALEAGELVMRRRREGVAVAATKSSAVDVVTAADRESEALIRDRLAELRPGDGFYGEETDPAASSTGIVWVVDPIDGTVNYLYGFPNYAISIAAVVGEPSSEPAAYATLAAVVHAPALGETYTATAGGGATRNDEPIRASSVTELGQSLVATGFSYDAADRRRQASAWAQIAGEFRDLRRMGAAALDLCAVACGRLDAYFESGTWPWDHAGGALIARESGAVVSGRGVGHGADREGRTLTVATAPGIADSFRRLIAPGFAPADEGPRAPTQ